MYGRAGLDRFKKAQTSEPFEVTAANSASRSSTKQTAFLEPVHSNAALINPNSATYPPEPVSIASVQQASQVGLGQSTWQPPDWAIEPLPGVYYLDVVKEGEVLGRINLDKRRHIFGRQLQTCDFVLEHQSVSRQHAAVVPHRNGGIYVIDLGSAHGTFVANERMTKDSPVELEVGQSLRFAASTRTYILRKNNADPFRSLLQQTDINLPPTPDPSDEEAVLAYNTYINRVLSGHKRPNNPSEVDGSVSRASKRVKKARVSFRDQVGGELAEVVGFSDGADVGTEPGPVGVKEGSLVGKYESLVQVTVIPKGREPAEPVPEAVSPKTGGVTEKLRQVLDKVKSSGSKSGGGGIYDDLYGESFTVGSSWAHSEAVISSRKNEKTPVSSSIVKHSENNGNEDDDDDDLFG